MHLLDIFLDVPYPSAQLSVRPPAVLVVPVVAKQGERGHYVAGQDDGVPLVLMA